MRKHYWLPILLFLFLNGWTIGIEEYCILNDNSSPQSIQNAIDYACEQLDPSLCDLFIGEDKACYLDSLFKRGSWATAVTYHKLKEKGLVCSFGLSAHEVTTMPEYLTCACTVDDTLSGYSAAHACYGVASKKLGDCNKASSKERCFCELYSSFNTCYQSFFCSDSLAALQEFNVDTSIISKKCLTGNAVTSTVSLASILILGIGSFFTFRGI